jgi:diaminohydroxyphosphoribosylaminopyrimidine deaminase/5-amino-6-(5-phosphoribosylamino)uracil reductase
MKKMKSTRSRELSHEDYMELCLSIARNGYGRVSPNPCVGALLVKNGSIIGEGYHEYFGGPHAEVNAINNAGGNVTGSTLYVNLEPCNISGKTPPCTDLIIRSGIRNVYIGIKDPNPRVAGRGIRQLRNTGIKVTCGILEDDCRRLNEPFLKFITTGLPYVAVKIAQTLDGKIADGHGNSKWISNIKSRVYAHTIRSRYDAILVGAGTVRTDNPQLTVRLAPGKNPIRVIVDGRFSSPKSSHVFTHQRQCPTIILCDQRSLTTSPIKKRYLETKGVKIKTFKTRQPGRIPPEEILEYLGSLGISSVLIEGGAQIISLFLAHRVVDKLYLFTASKILGTGLSAGEYLPALRLGDALVLSDSNVLKIKNDLLIESYFNNK